MGGSVIDAIGAIANPLGYLGTQLPNKAALTPEDTIRDIEEADTRLFGASNFQAAASDAQPLPEAPNSQNPEVLNAAKKARRPLGRAATYLSGSSSLLSGGNSFNRSLLGS